MRLSGSTAKKRSAKGDRNRLRLNALELLGPMAVTDVVANGERLIAGGYNSPAPAAEGHLMATSMHSRGHSSRETPLDETLEFHMALQLDGRLGGLAV